MPNSRLDASDHRILDTLQKDGRLSNIALAERIGLSPTPCLRRVRRLEAEGYIEGYGARIHRRAVGLGLTAFVNIAIQDHADHNAALFEEALRSRPEVVACHIVTGPADFLLEVVVPDLEAYSEFVLSTLLKLPGVKDVRSSFAMKTVKAPSILPLALAQDSDEGTPNAVTP